MRILFLTPQLPYPPQKGTALRNWGLIKGLAPRHDVDLLSFRAPGQDAELPQPLLESCQRVEMVAQPERSVWDRLEGMLITRYPDMALRLRSGGYAQRLADWLARESFDVIQVEGIELAPYLDVIEAAAQNSLVVFDDHNCEYLLQRRVFFTDLRAPARWPGAAYSFVQWLRLVRYEARVCRRADRVLTVSEADGAALKSLVPGLEPSVVPNGIDTTEYHRQAVDARPEENSLVFTGTMDFRPNVDAVLWFVDEVLPLIRTEIPDVHFTIVGQRPHARLEPLKGRPDVTLTGWVEDVRPYIASAEVYVVPLRMGGGTRLKLLEAMAMGKAVVATRLGAEGYPVTDGRELVLADTPTDFAEAVVSLLRSPRQRAELGRRGRTFVEQHYDWRAIVPLVEAVYPE